MAYGLRHSRRSWVWILALFAARPAPAAGQIRPATPPQQEAQARDPLGRETPRGALTGFTSAVHHQDYQTAAQYLQLTDAQRGQAGQLARDLQALMDRYFLEPMNRAGRRTTACHWIGNACRSQSRTSRWTSTWFASPIPRPDRSG